MTTDASSDGDHALNVLVQKREEASVRRKAFGIFHTAQMTSMQRMVEEEILDGRMLVRTDKHLYADVGLQAEFINLVRDTTNKQLHNRTLTISFTDFNLLVRG